MAYLPKNAQLTEVKDKVINADVDGDGRVEAVVAYYSVPYTPGAFTDSSEGFRDRARVRVLHWNGSDYETQWESDGFGDVFIGGGDNKQAYFDLHFAVLEVTTDGIPSIMCSRSGYNAMGTSFTVWHWNRKTYEKVLSLDMTPRLMVSKSRNAKYFALDRNAKNQPFETPKVFKWNPAKKTFSEVSTPPKDLEPCRMAVAQRSGK